MRSRSSAATELRAGARVVNPASRRVLEKCGFQWTGVELRKVLSLGSSVPVDRFRLDRGVWSSLKSWRNAVRHLGTAVTAGCGVTTGSARASLRSRMKM